MLYETGGWRHDKALTAPSPAIAGEAAELIWRCLKQGRIPKSRRQIELLIQ